MHDFVLYYKVMKYRWAFARKAEVSTVKMPENLTEVKLRRKDVFEGKIMTVHVDDVRLPNGETALREVACHPGAAGIVARHGDGAGVDI